MSRPETLAAVDLGFRCGARPAGERRLVVDVGGGSTEFIVGTGLEPELTESLYMGCVSYSLRFFPDGRIGKERVKAAELAARQELSSIVREYRAAGWTEAVGSSGTARSLEKILQQNDYAAGGLTRTGLERLKSQLIKHGKADPDRIAGLRPNRAPVLPGGHLLGRVQHRDMREVTIAQFIRRYHVDAAQAERVKNLALGIYDGLSPGADRD